MAVKNPNLKSAEELPILRRVPDVQDFNGVVFHAVGDDVRQPPVHHPPGATVRGCFPHVPCVHAGETF